MREVPFPDPGRPDTRSPLRFMAWVAREQWRTQLLGMVTGGFWMLAIALIPAQSTVNCAVKSIRPTGMVLLAVVRVSCDASAYSFHDVRKAKIAAEARPRLPNL